MLFSKSALHIMASVLRALVENFKCWVFIFTFILSLRDEKHPDSTKTVIKVAGVRNNEDN